MAVGKEQLAREDGNRQLAVGKGSWQLAREDGNRQLAVGKGSWQLAREVVEGSWLNGVGKKQVVGSWQES